MQDIRLGSTDTMITNYCLGTMTWGNQTAEADAHRQMDMALDAGITIVDTAEMYPVAPVRAETVGNTEAIMGRWHAANPGGRERYVLASKMAGLNGSFVRFDQPITSATFNEALEGSLRRLQTDHIDIYQLHWPNRGSYMFRQNWHYDPSTQDREATLANMLDVLEAAGAAQKAGKIGHFALSNESAWGTTQWIRLAREHGLPKVQSIQNEYSMMCRMFDTDLAETVINEAVTLLAFSPLAAGLLTGKYQGGAVPEGSRMSIEEKLGGRRSARAFQAVDAYLQLAREHGLDPVHMALAFTVQRPFACSTIFGATSVAQLEHILSGLDVTLPDEVMAGIDAIHKAHPMPY